MALTFRLRKHADYQRVYRSSRKQFSRQMSYFFAHRESTSAAAVEPTPRVGLTVGKVMGKAVDRNRIKRRMREAVRRNLSLLEGPIDVILHPRRSVIELDFATLDREVAHVFTSIRKASRLPSAETPAAPDKSLS
ncbi:MAG TPA: ribonuclease P protein component [Edaphobacter sp.]|jgi:ribonuclease P protein component|nr:ribonuclease P protein component [Edaphobacter sp.]